MLTKMTSEMVNLRKLKFIIIVPKPIRYNYDKITII